MADERTEPIGDGPFTGIVLRLHESATRAALEEVDYYEAIGDIDEDAARMLRHGIRIALLCEAMRYTGDASFTRRALPGDGKTAELIEALRRDEASRREHRIEIALHTLQEEWREQMPS